MGLLDKVAATRRAIGRKSWVEPPIWDHDRLAYAVYGGTAYSDRESPASDFETFAEAVYKGTGPISALMNVRLSVFSEARFQWQRMNGGRPGDLFGTADLALLETPWPNATTGDLLARLLQDADLAGNSYWTVVNGHLRRLRPD